MKGTIRTIHGKEVASLQTAMSVSCTMADDFRFAMAKSS
jgi:hypothetical protein